MRVGKAKIIMSPISETQAGRSKQSTQTPMTVSNKCTGSYSCSRIDPTSVNMDGGVGVLERHTQTAIVVTFCKQPWHERLRRWTLLLRPLPPVEPLFRLRLHRFFPTRSPTPSPDRLPWQPFEKFRAAQ